MTHTLINPFRSTFELGPVTVDVEFSGDVNDREHADIQSWSFVVHGKSCSTVITSGIEMYGDDVTDALAQEFRDLHCPCAAAHMIREGLKLSEITPRQFV